VREEDKKPAADLSSPGQEEVLMIVDRIDTTGTGTSGGAVMENSFSLARVLGHVVPGRFFVGAPGSVVFGFGVSPLLRLARTAVLLTLFATSLLAMTSSASADECSNETIRDEQHAHLSDCRAYELVSPVVKNGGDLMADSGRTRASSTGDAVSYSSLTAFGDAQGTGIGTEYLSERQSGGGGGSGWASHAITPPQSPLTFVAGAFLSLDPLYEGEMSSDLTKGVFRAWSPVGPEPNVGDVENLYLRDDLRTPGAGTYNLLTPCVVCATPLPPIVSVTQMPRLAGASRDFSHVIFESAHALVAEATEGQPNLYESDHGTLRLVGILPDGTAASQSVAGQGAGGGRSAGSYTMRTISADGARIFFTDPSATGDQTGQVYVRESHAVTAQLNASERAVPDPTGPQAAKFWTASTDGARAFFTTQEQLTDDDTNITNDLYMYDVAAAPNHHLTRLSVDKEPGDGSSAIGVIGASDDGQVVYFVASGQLVAGEPLLRTAPGIYAWHAGVTSFVGELSDPSTDTAVDLPGTWNLNQLGARVTPDGSTLLFTSHSGVGLTNYNHGLCGNDGCGEMYVYHERTHELECASCRPDGTPAAGDAFIATRAATGATDNSWHLNHALSDDGRFVFFNTSDRLVSEDTNGRVDAYEYDTKTHGVQLISSGVEASDSYFLDAGTNGADVFFLTREQLVGWDTDQGYDLYDARVGGGFPEPPPTPPACSGDACQGSPILPPAFDTPPSVTVSGQGNLKPVVSKEVSKSSSNSQELKRALKACKSKHGKAKRKKCESAARKKRFGKSGGSK
jgi:hypothetical protein